LEQTIMFNGNFAAARRPAGMPLQQTVRRATCPPAPALETLDV
jgi:hypothetical protein